MAELEPHSLTVGMIKDAVDKLRQSKPFQGYSMNLHPAAEEVLANNMPEFFAELKGEYIPPKDEEEAELWD